jgi:hypothetical protein
MKNNLINNDGYGGRLFNQGTNALDNGRPNIGAAGRYFGSWTNLVELKEIRLKLDF